MRQIQIKRLGGSESAMTKKKRPKPKKPATRKPREDTNQIAFRVMQEVIRKSEA
jgi:hypothetical protein